MWAGLAALFLRQIGHAVLEPPCHDKEALLLGFDTRKKTFILGAYLVIPLIHLASASHWNGAELGPMMVRIAREWLVWTLAVVGGRVAYLIWTHDIRLAMIWFVKLATDPLTDIAAYSPRYLRHR